MGTPDILQNHPEQRANSARRAAGVTSWPLRASLALLVLSTLAHPRPGHSQTENISPSDSATNNTLVLPASMTSEEVFQQLITLDESTFSETSEINKAKPDFLSSLEFSQGTESPPNPLKFTRFNGQQGEFFIDGATRGVFANGRTGIIATVELTLDGILKSKSQAPYRLYPEDTYQVATVADQYYPPADLAFFVDTYRRFSAEDPLYAPLVIRTVPLDKVDDPNAHSLLDITLPAGIVTEDPVRYFRFADDYSYIDVATKGYVNKDLNRINRVYLNKDATATRKVDAISYPVVYKAFISFVLNQFKPGFLIGWLG